MPDDDGMAAAMAQSNNQATALRGDDAIVLIGYLHERIQALEDLMAVIPPSVPELPGQMHGFGCIDRRYEAVRLAIRAICG